LDYQDFYLLLDSGETASCIFKKECLAFSGSKTNDAELAKEIIALANNETTVNYIIIGISSDGSSKSVDNRHLTDGQLQNFCQENIAPVPVVKLEEYTWKDAAAAAHKNKLFVIIRVAAEARQCFRFNQDFTDLKEL
jgi:Schlafen, AlbA_2